MASRFKHIYKSICAYLWLVFRNTRGADYKILNSYLVKISRLQDIDSIIYQLSGCLKSLLDHKLFAFAMYDKEYNGGVDIWMDRKTDDMAFLDCIKKDFSPKSHNCTIHYFDNPLEGDSSPECVTFSPGEVLSFKVMDSSTYAMLYLIPSRTLLPYHAELLNIIVKIMATSIANFIILKKLENAALIDPLTRCYNRRALDQHLRHDIASADRYGTDLAVMMFDIDYFKNINDTYGHRTGDAVLRAIAKSAQAAIRKSDYLVRYGGEEFVIVLPETKFSKAIELAERLRKIIQNMKITCDDKSISVTASFGVSSFKKGVSAQTILKKADEMLYDAKNQGRNRIKPDLRLCLTPLQGLPAEELLRH